MAEQTILIRAVDKASAALGNIDKRLSRMGKSVDNLERGFGGLTSKIVAVGSALGAAFGVRKILQTASSVEQLGIRFQFLFGSVEEGNKAFQEMLKFAGQVPFTLEQIQQGAGSLAVISDNADELAKNLKIVGNVAAVSGLDFRTASEQIQRAFSGGAAAAEIFRERGILALLGFQAGASVTAEETAKKFEEVFGPGGRFENATLALANTYEGVLSMIQDKIFQFTLALGNQGGLLEFAKGILGTLDNILKEQFGSIERFAELAGQRIIQVVQEFAIGVARMGDLLTPVFKFVRTGINNLVDFVNALPPIVRDFGIIGFFLLGPKFKIITVVIAALFDKIMMAFSFLAKGVEEILNKIVDGYNYVANAIGADPIETRFTFAGQNPDEFKQKVLDMFGDITDAMGEGAEPIGRMEEFMTGFFEQTKLTVEEQKKLRKEIEKVVGAAGGGGKEEGKSKAQQQLEKALGGIATKTGVDLGTLDPLQTEYEKQLEIIKQGEQQKLITLEQAEKARNKLKADYERQRTQRERREVTNTLELIKQGNVKVADIEALSGKQRVQLLGSIGKDLLGTLGQTNEKAFKLAKAIGIAEAIVNVARGVSAALALPFPFNLGAAALVAAQGFAQIQAIRSAQYTGPREKGGPVSAGQSYLVGEAGAEMFVPNAGGTIVPNNQLSGQPVTVNFNIETVDAEGFDELLVNRRGTIVGIINQAMNQRGKQGVTV